MKDKFDKIDVDYPTRLEREQSIGKVMGTMKKPFRMSRTVLATVLASIALIFALNSNVLKQDLDPTVYAMETTDGVQYAEVEIPKGEYNAGDFVYLTANDQTVALLEQFVIVAKASEVEEEVIGIYELTETDVDDLKKGNKKVKVEVVSEEEMTVEEVTVTMVHNANALENANENALENANENAAFKRQMSEKLAEKKQLIAEKKAMKANENSEKEKEQNEEKNQEQNNDADDAYEFQEMYRYAEQNGLLGELGLNQEQFQAFYQNGMTEENKEQYKEYFEALKEQVKAHGYKDDDEYDDDQDDNDDDEYDDEQDDNDDDEDSNGKEESNGSDKSNSNSNSSKGN